jgi:hypothetical protein
MPVSVAVLPIEQRTARTSQGLSPRDQRGSVRTRKDRARLVERESTCLGQLDAPLRAAKQGCL